MAKVVLRSAGFVVTEDPGGELSVEMLAGQGFALVPMRFALLPSERHLVSKDGFIDGLIEAYRRDPGRFRRKRRVEEL